MQPGLYIKLLFELSASVITSQPMKTGSHVPDFDGVFFCRSGPIRRSYTLCDGEIKVVVKGVRASVCARRTGDGE